MRGGLGTGARLRVGSDTNLERKLQIPAFPHVPNLRAMLEKMAVMVVTSSADRPQIYSERVRNLSGLNHTKLEQDA